MVDHGNQTRTRSESILRSIQYVGTCGCHFQYYVHPRDMDENILASKCSFQNLLGVTAAFYKCNTIDTKFQSRAKIRQVLVKKNARYIVWLLPSQHMATWSRRVYFRHYHCDGRAFMPCLTFSRYCAPFPPWAFDWRRGAPQNARFAQSRSLDETLLTWTKNYTFR